MNYFYLETFLGYLKITGENQVESVEFVSKKQKNNSNLFLEQVKKQFLNYFENQQNFNQIKINHNKQTSFQTRVFDTLKKVTSKQKTISYKDLAFKLKSKDYVRQVASALSCNQFPILNPCHRVIYANKKIGNYKFGKNIKHALINFENNDLSFLKIILPKWFNWQIIQQKCAFIPFYKLESNCISYLSNKTLVNIRFSNNCLYVNFKSNLAKAKVYLEIVQMFNLNVNYQNVLNYFQKTPFASLILQNDFINQVYWINPYQHLVRIIISQQLANVVSLQIYQIFLKLTSSKMNGVWLFPELSKVQKTPLSKLKKTGLSTKKIQTIKILTQLVLKKEIDFRNSKQTIETLLKIKGIGPWTINIFKMSSLKDPNVFPIKDLGLKMGIKRFFDLKQNPSEKEIEKYLKSIGKYKTSLANSLWNLKEKT